MTILLHCAKVIFGKICGYGGIGRRAGFRIRWATVQVQLLLPAPYKNANIDTVSVSISVLIFNRLRHDRDFFVQIIDFRIQCCAVQKYLLHQKAIVDDAFAFCHQLIVVNQKN